MRDLPHAARIGGYERGVGAPLSIVRQPKSSDADLLLETTDDDTGVQRSWQWCVEESATHGEVDGALITLQDRGTIANPIVRFFASFRGCAGSVERTLSALAHHLGEQHASVQRADGA